MLTSAIGTMREISSSLGAALRKVRKYEPLRPAVLGSTRQEEWARQLSLNHCLFDSGVT
jgi:hypothetical protein